MQLRIMELVMMRSLAIVLALLLAAVVTSCSSSVPRAPTQEQIVQQSEKLSRQYLDADLSTARDCLMKEAKLLENASNLEPSGRAQRLSLTYFRLYSLDQRSGDEPAAKADLMKAHYWRLIKSELSNVPQSEAVREIEQLVGERVFKEVDQLDAKQHLGSPANYTHHFGLEK